MIFFGWNGPVGFVATAGVMLHHDPKMMGEKHLQTEVEGEGAALISSFDLIIWLDFLVSLKKEHVLLCLTH